MSFTTAKDRIFTTYNRFAGWLARRSSPVRQGVYKLLGGLFWFAYLLPGTSVRPTLNALAKHIGGPSPRQIYSGYIKGFFRGLDRSERIRHGFGAEVDKMLVIPEQDRLKQLVGQGGFVLVMPHVHGSFAMARGLTQHNDVMCLVRLTSNELRAEAQRELYREVKCDFHDVRHGNASSVARVLLRSLKAGKIVIGLVDRIEYPTPVPSDPASELLAAKAFGQDINIASWPARFGMKAGVPIVPATVVQTKNEVRLIMGQTITPSDDLAATTQEWVSELEILMRAHPDEWAFWLDKNWSRVLQSTSTV